MATTAIATLEIVVHAISGQYQLKNRVQERRRRYAGMQDTNRDWR